MTDVVTFGETMAALRGAGPLRLGGTLRLSIAGSESNVAIGLARLGHRVRWAGRVGADELGELVRRTLRAEGVDTSTVTIDPERPTGLLIFERRVAETVLVSYYRAGSAGGALDPDDVLGALSDGPRVLHLTGITAALGAQPQQAVREAIGRATERGITVSLDVNHRTRLWSAAAARDVLRPLLRSVDVLFASADELPLVATDPAASPDASARQLVAAGVGTVVVKNGASGATAYTPDGRIHVPAKIVHVRDPVGAGDAFVAGYLSAGLDGLDVRASLERAAVLGAFAVAHDGDWEGLPSRAELHLLDAPPGTTLR